MYQAELADELDRQHRLVFHRKELKSEQLIQITQKYLRLTWSPEQISNTVLNEGTINSLTEFNFFHNSSKLGETLDFMYVG